MPTASITLLEELRDHYNEWPPDDFLDGEAFDEAFDDLNERERRVLFLKWQIGLDQGEIGELIRPPTVQQGVSRIEKIATAKIRARMVPPPMKPFRSTSTGNAARAKMPKL